jgi:hypothetical protein
MNPHPEPAPDATTEAGGGGRPAARKRAAWGRAAGPEVLRHGLALQAGLAALAGLLSCAPGQRVRLTPVGQWPGYAHGYTVDVAVSGGYPYVAAGQTGLQVIDVRDPAKPVRVGGYDTPGRALDVAVADGHAYVTDATAGLLVIDVRDPARPARVGGYRTGGLPMRVAVEGGYAYVTASYDGLLVIDARDTARPVRVGGYDTAGVARAWGCRAFTPT